MFSNSYNSANKDLPHIINYKCNDTQSVLLNVILEYMRTLYYHMNNLEILYTPIASRKPDNLTNYDTINVLKYLSDKNHDQHKLIEATLDNVLNFIEIYLLTYTGFTNFKYLINYSLTSNSLPITFVVDSVTIYAYINVHKITKIIEEFTISWLYTNIEIERPHEIQQLNSKLLSRKSSSFSSSSSNYNLNQNCNGGSLNNLASIRENILQKQQKHFEQQRVNHCLFGNNDLEDYDDPIEDNLSPEDVLNNLLTKMLCEKSSGLCYRLVWLVHIQIDKAFNDAIAMLSLSQTHKQLYPYKLNLSASSTTISNPRDKNLLFNFKSFMD